MALCLSKHPQASPQIYTELCELAAQLQIMQQPWHIHLCPQAIDITDPSDTLAPLKLSFTDATAAYLQKTLTAKQPLLRAIGKIHLPPATIIDCTAGFGQDSFILTSAGHHLVSIEQNPVVYLLLATSIKLYKQQHPDCTWQAVHANSCSWLQQNRKKVDAIYLDPFFEKNTSALPKNRIQWLQKLADTTDNHDARLLNQALLADCGRVVVKRDLKAPFLNNIKPNSGSIQQKSSRFDCYYPKHSC